MKEKKQYAHHGCNFSDNSIHKVGVWVLAGAPENRAAAVVGKGSREVENFQWIRSPDKYPIPRHVTSYTGHIGSQHSGPPTSTFTHDSCLIHTRLL